MNEDIGIILFLIISIIIALTIQLLLCFKTKRLSIKLIPTILFIIMAIMFYIKSEAAEGWNGLGYGLLYIYNIFLTLTTGASWIVYGVTKAIKKRNKKP